MMQAENDAVKHAAECAPAEACGMIVAGEYVPCVNVADDPQNGFRIGRDEWRADAEALVHSHPDGCPWLSAADRFHQHRTGLPWWLVAGGRVIVYPYVPLLRGRTWNYPQRDCWQLVVDAYALAGIALFNPPREGLKKDAAKFAALMSEAGFDEVQEMQPGDVLLSDYAGELNHAGVYVGNGCVLHHPLGQLSRVEPVGKGWSRIWRHREFADFEPLANDLQHSS